MLVVLIATGAIVKDYVLGSVLFAVVVLLSFAIGRGRMAASFSFAYLFLMGIFWVTTMLPPNAAGALGSFALACRTCMPICLFAAVEDAAFDIPMCGNKLKYLGTGLNSVPFHKLNKLRAELVFDPRHIRANLSDP